MMYVLWLFGSICLAIVVCSILALLIAFTSFYCNEKMGNDVENSDGKLAAAAIWLCIGSLLNPLMYLLS